MGWVELRYGKVFIKQVINSIAGFGAGVEKLGNIGQNKKKILIYKN